MLSDFFLLFSLDVFISFLVKVDLRNNNFEDVLHKNYS